MAAITTKKPGGDVALEMTFPAVYSEVYADSGEGEGYMPTVNWAPPKMEMDPDLQGAYHEQKRKDAHAMVMAGVAADKAAEAKMLASHMNYFGLPKPVLSQRIFANPSLGNLSGAIDSARRTMPGSDAPFHCMDTAGSSGGCGSCYETQMRGGVLRTKMGQQWAAEKLQGRVQQLDAIDAAAMTPEALDEGTGVEFPDVAEQFAPGAQLDFSVLLDQVENALDGADLGIASRFTLTDLADTVKMAVRFATVADREDVESAYARIDSILQALRGLMAQRAPGGPRAPPAGARYRGARERIAADNQQLAEFMVPRLEALRKYLGDMLAAVNLQPKDRQAASRTALKSSGLLSLTRRMLPADVRAAVAGVVPAVPAGVPGVGPQPPFPPPAPPGGRPGGPGGPPPPGGPYRYPPAGPQGRRRGAVAAVAAAEVPGAAEAVRVARLGMADAAALQRQAVQQGLPPNAIPAGRLGALDALRAYQARQPEVQARFAREMRQVRGQPGRNGAYLGEALAPADLPEPAGVNPFRRGAAVGLRELQEAPEPVFGEMPAGEYAFAPRVAARAPPQGPRPPAAVMEVRRQLAGLPAAGAAGDEGLRRAAARLGDALREQEGRLAPVRRTERIRKAVAPGEALGSRGARGYGKRSPKWIQEVVAHMKKGALTREASEKGMTPLDFAKYVAAHPDDFTLTTRRRAQFLLNIQPAKTRGKGRTEAEKAAAVARMVAARKAAAATSRAKAAKARSPSPKKKAAKKPTAAAPAPTAAAPAPTSAAADDGAAARAARADWERRAEAGLREEGIAAIQKEFLDRGSYVSRRGAETLYDERLKTHKTADPTRFKSATGFGKAHGLTRANLPKDREGFVALAAKLRGMGHDIRVNSGSQLKSIRANFIRKFGL